MQTGYYWSMGHNIDETKEVLPLCNMVGSLGSTEMLNTFLDNLIFDVCTQNGSFPSIQVTLVGENTAQLESPVWSTNFNNKINLEYGNVPMDIPCKFMAIIKDIYKCVKSREAIMTSMGVDNFVDYGDIDPYYCALQKCM